MKRDELDQCLLKAHADDNKQELIRLYRAAGDMSEEAGDIDAACFYFTHAFVFALELGSPEAQDINQRLVDYGRADRLPFDA